MRDRRIHGYCGEEPGFSGGPVRGVPPESNPRILLDFWRKEEAGARIRTADLLITKRFGQVSADGRRRPNLLFWRLLLEFRHSMDVR
jgi:hypothetical protein